jgi:hypothetical protein
MSPQITIDLPESAFSSYVLTQKTLEGDATDGGGQLV